MSAHNTNARLEAFSDGVFAIAITLLILEIKVPPLESIHSNKELWLAFAKTWPSWVAFLMSFLTVLISWVNHSHGLKLLDKSSPLFTYANGLLLLVIIILPVPTHAVAEYLNTPFMQPAVSIYCGFNLLCNIAWQLSSFTTLYPKSLYKANVDLLKVKRLMKQARVGLLIYGVTFGLSFWFPLVAFIITALSFVLWFIGGLTAHDANLEKG